MKNPTVTTWADGCGIWHARIDGLAIGTAGIGMDAVRQRARRAIRRELQARQGAPLAPVRVRVVANRLDHMNVLRSITYAERVK